MTIFVAHAPADSEAAEALERFLERRGQFVELDDGSAALRPVQPSDAVVLLLSKDFVFALGRLRLEQRALDAWADGRLILVKLDHAFAPVGLRDLPAIDASFEAQREFKWGEVADAIRNALRAPNDGAPPSEDVKPASKQRGRARPFLFIAPLLMLPGLLAIAASVSIWLANRIGPTPGGWPELAHGIEQLGVRYGAPSGVTIWVFAAALALFVFVLLMLIAGAFRKPKRTERAAPAPAQAAPVTSDAVFVSYARANAQAVVPVIEGASGEGRKFWLDKQNIGGGESWAGEIVRAIRGATEVVVMCSRAAFESDHVKREIYLADRYRKRMLPVFIEEAAPPEDFEYFFAGVQSLNLFETPEAERSQALLRVLGASS